MALLIHKIANEIQEIKSWKTSPGTIKPTKILPNKESQSWGHYTAYHDIVTNY
jgi:hypothetical protein